jgi:hypothetical protein
MEGPPASSRRLGRIEHALVCEWNLVKIDHCRQFNVKLYRQFSRRARSAHFGYQQDVRDFAVGGTRTRQGAARCQVRAICPNLTCACPNLLHRPVVKPFAIRPNRAHSCKHHRLRLCTRRRWLRAGTRSRLKSGIHSSWQRHSNHYRRRASSAAPRLSSPRHSRRANAFSWFDARRARVPAPTLSITAPYASGELS